MNEHKERIKSELVKNLKKNGTRQEKKRKNKIKGIEEQTVREPQKTQGQLNEGIEKENERKKKPRESAVNDTP